MKGPEERANLLSRITFWFLNDLLTLGARRPLETQDLPPVLPSVSASQTYEAFSAAWEAEKRTASERKLQPSVYRALRASVLRDWWKSYLAFALASALSFAPPMLLSVLVGDFEDTRDLSDTQRWLVVCGLFVLPLMQSLLLTQHDMFVTRLGYKARSALTAAVYFKSLKLTSAARSASSSGAVTNLMSTDAASVILAAQNANTLWAAPVVVAVAMWLLYEQVGASAFVGIGFMFVLFPVNGVVFGKVAMYRRQLLAFSDQRVKLINEFFSGVRVVKMYAWEEALKAKITEIRDQELGLLYRMALLISIGFLFVLLAAPLLLPILVFVTYTKTGNDLDAAKAFTTISLFNLIRIPFSFLPMSLQFVAQAIASLGRIRNFLLLEELDSVNFSVPPCTDQELAIVIRQGHFRWEALPPVQQQGKPAAPDKAASSAPAPVAAPAVPNGVDRPQMRGSQRALLTRDGSTVSLDGRSNVELTHTGEAADAAFELRGVNLRVPKGVLCAVVGPFGSGKSSLLAAILGEMRRVGGEVHASGTFAYCAQQPWIFNGSLKNNVRFNPEKELNGALYDQALDASALRADLAQLHDGDETEIGERGINLSGGQKARVALARAIYSGADVVLIDDVLSAVDPHVAEHIFKEALCKALKGRTRVVVTNQIQFLPSCDYIVFLDRGQVAEQGRYDELMRANQGFAQLIQKHSLRTSSPSGGGAAAADAESDAKTTGNEADVVNGQREASAARKRAAATAAVTAAAKGKALGGEGPAKLVKDEERFAGAVSMNTYMRYAMAMGMVAAMVQWALLASDQVARIGGDFWLARFSDRFRNQASLPQSEIDWYIFIYLAWGLGGCVVIVVRSTMFAKYRIVASRRLHNTMLQRITWAPMRFFEGTPVGRLLNRFSRDIDTIDLTLPPALIQCLAGIYTILGILVAVSIGTKGLFLPALVPLMAVYYTVQRFYRRTSTEIQRLDSISRSPLFAHFGETLSGVSTIRAFRDAWRFINTNRELSDNNTRPSYCFWLASNWLAVRLDVLGASVSFVIALVAVLRRDLIPPGWAAVALTYAFALSATLKWAVRMMADTESAFTSVERVGFYSEQVEQEAPAVVPERRPREDWPSQGRIEVRDLWVAYRKDEPVLKGLNFSVNPGERIGVVGRTGSGKSTLMLSLLRIVEPVRGSVLIDDVNIHEIGLHDLRSHIAIIPQDPVLFSGNVRRNLDPFDRYSDEEIWRALSLSQMKDYVQALDGGLSAVVAENGENFSVGQRQMLCVARAILRKAHVLLLDEATASIDVESDFKIQQMIRQNFQGVTILTIAHRLSTVIDSDRVLVLDQGTIAEYDAPKTLLAKGGLFRSMVEAHEKAQRGGASVEAL